MPDYVATIEVFFEADSFADACRDADLMADVVVEHALSVRVGSVSSSVVLDDD